MPKRTNINDIILVVTQLIILICVIYMVLTNA